MRSADTAESSYRFAEAPNAALIIMGVMQFLKTLLASTYAKRALGFLLIAAGMPSKRIARLTGVGERTVRNWRHLLKSAAEIADVGTYLTRPPVDPGRKCYAVKDAIFAELEQNNYHTLRQIADMIRDRFGLPLSLSAVRRLLREGGYTKRRSGSLPAKADTAQQKDFWMQTLKPLTEQACAGKIRLLFMDASHFVLGCDFLGSVWSRVRRFIKTYSGRHRYNVLGAIDYVTHEMLTVTNDTYITATQVGDMLRKLAKSRESGGPQSVFVVSGNARYQKCRFVAELAAELNIQLIYLPPYSPNLNLIERLWKLMKSELRTRYYDDFASFRQRIDDIIAGLTTVYSDRVSTLLRTVHLFNHLTPLCPDTYAETAGTRASA